MSFGSPTVALMNSFHSIFKRWLGANAAGDAAVFGAVVIASVALTCLGI